MTRGSRRSSPRTLAHALRAGARVLVLSLGFGLADAALGPGGRLLADDVEDLAELSLEQLSGIEVLSVSRRPERLSEAAAS